MLRIATLDDLAAVTSWVRSQHDCDLWTGGRVRFPVDLAALPTCIRFNEQQPYVWNIDGRVAAFGQIIIKPTGRVHLATIIVDPSIRGRGQGKQFVGALLTMARLQGRQISLNVDTLNSAAISVYQTLGFADATRPPDQDERPGVRYMEYGGS